MKAREHGNWAWAWAWAFVGVLSIIAQQDPGLAIGLFGLRAIGLGGPMERVDFADPVFFLSCGLTFNARLLHSSLILFFVFLRPRGLFLILFFLYFILSSLFLLCSARAFLALSFLVYFQLSFFFPTRVVFSSFLLFPSSQLFFFLFLSASTFFLSFLDSTDAIFFLAFLPARGPSLFFLYFNSSVPGAGRERWRQPGAGLFGWCDARGSGKVADRRAGRRGGDFNLIWSGCGTWWGCHSNDGWARWQQGLGRRRQGTAALWTHNHRRPQDSAGWLWVLWNHSVCRLIKPWIYLKIMVDG